MRPQGDMVAFTVMTIVEKENTRHREIWLQPLANGKASGAAFRFTSPTENSAQPRWSPDGACSPSRPTRQGREQHLVCARRGDRRGGVPSRRRLCRSGVVARRQVDRLRQGADARRGRRRHRRQEGRARRLGGSRCAHPDPGRQALRRARHHLDALQVERHVDLAAALQHARTWRRSSSCRPKAARRCSSRGWLMRRRRSSGRQTARPSSSPPIPDRTTSTTAN